MAPHAGGSLTAKTTAKAVYDGGRGRTMMESCPSRLILSGR